MKAGLYNTSYFSAKILFFLLHTFLKHISPSDDTLAALRFAIWRPASNDQHSSKLQILDFQLEGSRKTDLRIITSSKALTKTSSLARLRPGVWRTVPPAHHLTKTQNLFSSLSSCLKLLSISSSCFKDIQSSTYAHHLALPSGNPCIMADQRTFTRFFELPQELRDLVYEHAFGSDLEVSDIVAKKEWRKIELRKREMQSWSFPRPVNNTPYEVSSRA